MSSRNFHLQARLEKGRDGVRFYFRKVQIVYQLSSFIGAIILAVLDPLK